MSINKRYIPKLSELNSINTGSSFSKQNEDLEIEPIYSFTEADEDRFDYCKKLRNHLKTPVDQRLKNRAYLNQDFTNRFYDKIGNSYKKLEKPCSACRDYVLTIEVMRKEQKVLSDKYLATERHLKQYDDLLILKENRLKQQEFTVKTEFGILEKEKEKVVIERKKIDEAKLELSKEQEYLAFQNERIDHAFKEINKKQAELESILNDIDHKKQELRIMEENQRKNIFFNKSPLLISRKNNIQQLLEELKIEKTESDLEKNFFFDEKPKKVAKKLQQKKETLEKLALELFEMKKKIEAENEKNEKIFELKIFEFEKTEKQLAEKEKSVEEAQQRINEELESIEELKTVLKSQQENLEKEKKTMAENYEQRLSNFEYFKNIKIEAPSFSSGKGEENKEKLVLEAGVEESSSRSSKISDSDSEENPKYSEIQKTNSELTKKCEELEKKLNEVLSKSFETQEKNKEYLLTIEKYQISTIELQEKVFHLEKSLEAFNSPETISLEFKNLYTELSKKLETLTKKEKEIIELQNLVALEKQSIESEAEILKKISEELKDEKIKIHDEKIIFEQHKAKILELDGKQLDKEKLLMNKENELLNFKEKLMEREKLLKIKERKIASPKAQEDSFFKKAVKMI